MKIKTAAVDPTYSAELTDRDLRKFLFLQKFQKAPPAKRVVYFVSITGTLRR